MKFDKSTLYCAKMIRQTDELKTILCEDNGKKCICTSCVEESEGYIVNSWYKECPRFEAQFSKRTGKNGLVH